MRLLSIFIVCALLLTYLAMTLAASRFQEMMAKTKNKKERDFTPSERDFVKRLDKAKTSKTFERTKDIKLRDIAEASSIRRKSRKVRGKNKDFFKLEKFTIDSDRLERLARKTKKRLNLESKGKSGKLSIGRGNHTETDRNRVEIIFHEMAELDIDEKPVGMRGENKHHFSETDFEALDFWTSDIENKTFQGIEVDEFSLDATLGHVGANLTMSVMIFTENGTMVLNNESTTVVAGDVKFNVEVEGWPFCDGSELDCQKDGQSEVGSYLKLILVLKSRGQPKKRTGSFKRRKTDADEYDVGGGAELVMSRMLEADGNWTEMKEGYPRYELTGNKQRFVLMLPKVNERVMYDPIVQAATVEDGAVNHIIHATSAAFIAALILPLISRLILA